MQIKRIVVSLIGMGLLGAFVSAQADPQTDTAQTQTSFLPHVNIDGNLRLYNFWRDYSNATPDQSAFSVGGKLNLLTDAFWNGFKVGATLYTAQPLGMNASNPSRRDSTLPATPITVLGQSYLQYQDKYVLVRAGNQLITTPWLNDADSRMIPATYQGIYSTVSPIKDLNFTAMRIIRFKSRIADDFSRTNVFYPTNGGSIKGLNDTASEGAAAVGSQYTYGDFNTQAWGYQFYNYGKLVYGDANYKLAASNFVKPLVGVQIAREWNDGSQTLNALGLGATNATAYGVLLGAEVGEGKLTIGYNAIPRHSHAYYRNGDFVSPYTSASDPLYTTSMVAGLVDKAAGSAIKVGAQYYLYDRQVLLKASYAKYNTTPYTPNTNETDLDATYKFNKGKLKNLSIRGRLAVLNGNPAYGKLVYSRLMLQYDFA